MKKLILLLIMLLGVLCMAEAKAQLPHCCKNKVRIRKQSKRARGALVGVKGKKNNLSLKKQEKERAKAFKASKKEKRLVEKEKASLDTTTTREKKKKRKKLLTKDEKVSKALEEIFGEEKKNLEED